MRLHTHKCNTEGGGGGECTVPVPYQWPRRNYKLM